MAEQDELDPEEVSMTEKVSELSLMGLTQTKIAERLGISQPAVSYHLNRAKDLWRQRRAVSYEDWLDQEVEHYTVLLSKLEIGIQRGDWKAIQTAVNLAERRSKLIGLDHSSKMEEARVRLEAAQIDLMARMVEAALAVIPGLEESHRRAAIEAGLAVVEGSTEPSEAL